MRDGIPSIAAVAALLTTLAGCGEGPAPGAVDAGPDLVGPGEACAPAVPCEARLVCVDGRCRERPWPPDAGPLPELPDLRDVASDVPVAEPDGDDAGPGGDAADVEIDLPEALPDPGPELPDGVGELPVDAPPPDPGPTDGGAPDADAVEVDAADAETILLLIREDEADTGLGSLFASLEEGDGWVTELTLPLPGVIVGMEVVIRNTFGPDSCALFLPAVWVPDAQGDFAAGPSYVASEPQLLESADGPQAFLFADEGPSVGQGKIRIGLILDGSCEGVPSTPGLATDDTGDTARTFVWIPGGDGTPWVSGEELGLDGRWAMRVLIEVVWPPDG